MQQATNRVSSGVAGLDRMLGGGLLPGDSTLIAGSPGTGKTTFGLHFLAAGVRESEPGVFVTFEYLPQQIYRDAAAKGIPLKEWEEEGKVALLCTTPDLLLAQSERGQTILDEAMRDVGARRLVLDSMTHFEFYGHQPHLLREQLAGLMNHLRLFGATTLVTHEVPQIFGPSVTISNYGLEFLVDNVILLRYVELEGSLEKAINVLKFRGGEHDRTYHRVALTDAGALVEASFEGIENISGGTARRALARRAEGLI